METWQNYAIQKRLRDLANYLTPALGARHPICRRIVDAKEWVPRIEDPARICRRISKLRAFVVASLPPETRIDPFALANLKWGKP